MPRWTTLAALLGLAVPAAAAGRIVERLDRGLVARPVAGGKVYLSWRLLPTDPPDIGFVGVVGQVNLAGGIVARRQRKAASAVVERSQRRAAAMSAEEQIKLVVAVEIDQVQAA